MTMYHFLRVVDDLETMRQKLAEEHKRPCYLVAGIPAKTHRGTLHRKPGAYSYEHLTEWDLFFTSWWDQGRCVRREDQVNGPTLVYFDLELSPVLRFLLPETKAERREQLDNYEQFSLVGLRRNWNGASLWVDKHPVPEELQPFVEEYKRRRAGNALAREPGIQFIASELIQTPVVQRDRWHFGDVGPLSDRLKFRPLHAPGQYNGQPLTMLESINRMARVDCDPGPCIVCHGSTGERVHLATLAMSETVYPAGHICRACTKTTFAEWQALLESAER